MTNKDVGFVHLEAKVVEKAMMELEGKPFNGGNMKIEYGQIGKKVWLKFYHYNQCIFNQLHSIRNVEKSSWAQGSA